MRHATSLHSWIVGFVGLLLEVESGARPARHLRPMLGAGLQGRMRLTPPTRARLDDGYIGTRIGRVLVQTTPDRCEAVVLLHHSRRTTALTLTLIRDDIGWLVVDLGRPGEPVDTPRLPPPQPPLAQVAWHHEATALPRPHWRIPAGWAKPAAA